MEIIMVHIKQQLKKQDMTAGGAQTTSQALPGLQQTQIMMSEPRMQFAAQRCQPDSIPSLTTVTFSLWA